MTPKPQNGSLVPAPKPENVSISCLASKDSIHALEPGHYELVIDSIEGWEQFKSWIDGQFREGATVPLRIKRPDGTVSVLIRA